MKGPLNRNLEDLLPEQFSKIIKTLDSGGHGQQIALAWIAKGKLRAALNLRARTSRSQPPERQVRDQFLASYDWCPRPAPGTRPPHSCQRPTAA